MTYKYQYIRREIYEKNPEGELNSYRSFTDMVRLFRLPFWIMLGSLLIACIFLVVVVIFYPKSLLIWIPIIIIFVVNMLSQIPREKYFYHSKARENEVLEKMKNYEQYTSGVREVLHSQGIDTPEKLKALRKECELTLKSREDRYIKINGKIIDMLIGVPLGALIASLIYVDKNTVPTTIGSIIVIGLVTIGIAKLVKLINYYSEGYFKDKYLLDAINEMEYSEITINSCPSKDNSF
jgi:hypothetical protein